MTNITDREIRSCISKLNAGEAQRAELREGGERGAGRLSIVMRAGKTRTSAEWYAEWSREGRKTSTKIGSYPSMSLADARKAFREDYAPIILTGRNPRGVRAWTKNQDATVRGLFEAYVESLKANKKTPGSVKGAHYCLLGPKGAANAFGPNRPAADITAEDILQHLGEIHQRGSVYQANNVRAWIHSAFQFGVRSAHSYHEVGSGTAWGLKTNPASTISTDPAAFKPRDRFLSPEEFKAFWDWLTEKGQSFRYRHAPAMQLIMATGQRPSEIFRLGEASFDTDERTVSWATTKNGRPHCIPLPDVAFEILSAARPNRYGHFFPAQKSPAQPAAHFTSEPLIRRYLQETGAAKFVARDLRRTWKTLAGAAGLSKDIRDRYQNHALVDVSSKHYDKYDYMAEKRDAAAAWNAYLVKLLTEDEGGVVEFARPVRVTKEPVVLGLQQPG